MFIEPTNIRVPSVFSRYSWLDYKNCPVWSFVTILTFFTLFKINWTAASQQHEVDNHPSFTRCISIALWQWRTGPGCRVRSHPGPPNQGRIQRVLLGGMYLNRPLAKKLFYSIKQQTGFFSFLVCVV